YSARDMNPRIGEKPPFKSSSRSQSCRGVRSHDGHSRDSARRERMRSGFAKGSTSSPPCGAIRHCLSIHLLRAPVGKISMWPDSFTKRARWRRALEIQSERELHLPGRISGVRSTEKRRRLRAYVILEVHTVQDVKGIDPDVDSWPVFVLFKVKGPR